jgi:hypothetical protein
MDGEVPIVAASGKVYETGALTMKTRCLCAAIAVALLAYLPVRAAEDTFQMEAITLSNSTAADASLPAVQMVSATIVSASSVTVNPCLGGTQGCPNPTVGYASIPFPASVLPAGGDAVVTWMFQDLSYSGPIQMTVAFHPERCGGRGTFHLAF